MNENDELFYYISNIYINSCKFQSALGDITYEQASELAKIATLAKNLDSLCKTLEQTNEYLRDISDALDDFAEDLSKD